MIYAPYVCTLAGNGRGLRGEVSVGSPFRALGGNPSGNGLVLMEVECQLVCMGVRDVWGARTDGM